MTNRLNFSIAHPDSCPCNTCVMLSPITVTHEMSEYDGKSGYWVCATVFCLTFWAFFFTFALSH